MPQEAGASKTKAFAKNVVINQKLKSEVQIVEWTKGSSAKCNFWEMRVITNLCK